MKIQLKPKKGRFTAWLTVALLLLVLLWWRWPKQATPPASSPPPSHSHPRITQAFDKSRYPVDQADSLWAIVNKGRVLPSDYVPQPLGSYGLRRDAGAALAKLFAAAHTAGLDLKLTSGYRSYTDQQSVYSGYVRQYGVAKADSFSARPGHSEHQTGLAADVEPSSGQCRLDICFGKTAEGRWLAANAYEYGFIIRYQKDQEDLTGYQYEPWHIRYVGTDLASELWHGGQTMEQFFDLETFSVKQAYPTHQVTLK